MHASSLKMSIFDNKFPRMCKKPTFQEMLFSFYKNIFRFYAKVFSKMCVNFADEFSKILTKPKKEVAKSFVPTNELKKYSSLPTIEPNL